MSAGRSGTFVFEGRRFVTDPDRHAENASGLRRIARSTEWRSVRLGVGLPLSAIGVLLLVVGLALTNPQTPDTLRSPVIGSVLLVLAAASIVGAFLLIPNWGRSEALIMVKQGRALPLPIDRYEITTRDQRLLWDATLADVELFTLGHLELSDGRSVDLLVPPDQWDATVATIEEVEAAAALERHRIAALFAGSPPTEPPGR